MNATARWLLAAIYLASPALLALLFLAVAGALAPDSAAIAATGVVLAVALLSRPVFVGLSRLRVAVDELSRNPAARPEIESASPAIRELWLAILRWVRAQQQLAEAREAKIDTAQLVLHHLPDPLLVLDERRRIVRVNEAGAELLGPRLLDRDLAIALRQPALLTAADAVLHGEGDRLVDFDLATPVERQFSARIVPLVPPRPDGAAALILHDVTALKRSERMRADFAANASHELRTPLTSLIGFVETLRGPAREDRAAHDRFLAIMADQAARMARVVEDLLSLSKIEMNEHHTPTARVDIPDVLERVSSGLEQRAAKRNMRIRRIVLPDAPPVLGDADELAQVFQNLIDNAIKYARAGTAITIEVAPSIKTLAGLRAGERLPALAIAIRDRGEGIPREHLARLTERFYRVDTARSRELGGTGLGLAIVKHIVNHHRGVLEIESELGQGSVFTVHLPMAAPPAAASAGVTPQPAAAGGLERNPGEKS
jgi:two-component system, OmpR family, phosphate regulon sensor histidine kinase PhoR